MCALLQFHRGHDVQQISVVVGQVELNLFAVVVRVVEYTVAVVVDPGVEKTCLRRFDFPIAIDHGCQRRVDGHRRLCSRCDGRDKYDRLFIVLEQQVIPQRLRVWDAVKFSVNAGITDQDQVLPCRPLRWWADHRGNSLP